mmetsp:Transcript_23943/g.49752  ORF Transcript_23943/g.49752 Transcript_23943/m.49752 type:complete len:89 (+) Transcript_23943:1873-2139(+)
MCNRLPVEPPSIIIENGDSALTAAVIQEMVKKHKSLAMLQIFYRQETSGTQSTTMKYMTRDSKRFNRMERRCHHNARTNGELKWNRTQ